MNLKRVLIVDHGKAALVMSSEILKELIPGVSIEIARTGKEALEMAKTLEEYSLVLVEFDMPDGDGVTITNLLRRHHTGPIFLCAFPDKIVDIAVNSEMLAFDDAREWIPKPLKKNDFIKKIEKYVEKKHAISRRFYTLGLDTHIVGKASGRGKRAPKYDGTLQNISFGGACIATDETKSLLKKHELTLTIKIPTDSGKSKKPSFTKQSFKGRLAWKKDDRIGIEFGKMTETQRKKLEAFIRQST